MAEADPARPFAGQSLAQVRRAVALLLTPAGVEAPEREARLLLEYATGLSPERLLLDEARVLSEAEAQVLEAALARRLAHEPLSRIRGERDFFGRSFAVTPAVLDPRPETETVVEAILAHVAATGDPARRLRLLDVGTGSGALIVTLLAECAGATGLATDVSADALAVAEANARRHGVADRVSFALKRGLHGVDGGFDILVSNPPYIPSAEIATLSAEVRDFDPWLALDGGRDGLDIYRDLAAGAAAVVPAGLIALEVGAGQADDVARIFREALGPRCRAVRVHPDLGGHSRCVAILTQC